MLNPNSPIPLYHQLAEILIDRIRQKAFLPGAALPSETVLARQYGIGRPTVRQAMDMLCKKGLIERKRGSGTYVKEPGIEVDLFSLAGTSAAFQTQGIHVSTTILEHTHRVTVPTDPDNPFSEKTAYFLSRVTRTDAAPVLIEEIYLDPVLFAGIDRIDLSDQSLARVVAEQYYLIPETGRQTFKIGMAKDCISVWLEIPDTTPVLEVRRVLNFPHAPGGVFSRLICRTDTFVFAQEISTAGHMTIR